MKIDQTYNHIAVAATDNRPHVRRGIAVSRIVQNVRKEMTDEKKGSVQNGFSHRVLYDMIAIFKQV